MGLIERQTPRQPVLTPGQQLVTSDQERDLNLIAGRVLIARDLGAQPEEVRAEIEVVSIDPSEAYRQAIWTARPMRGSCASI